MITPPLVCDIDRVPGGMFAVTFNSLVAFTALPGRGNNRGPALVIFSGQAIRNFGGKSCTTLLYCSYYKPATYCLHPIISDLRVSESGNFRNKLFSLKWRRKAPSPFAKELLQADLARQILVTVLTALQSSSTRCLHYILSQCYH